ncbi:metal dependent phosphohydrolase [Phlyctema vagabunda]|uniref:Metal dependent phosphohydrolase n=1 Tax=Phlyctema vagabunda TaxID=108571 RepID=A0ABR4PMG7_9HELO
MCHFGKDRRDESTGSLSVAKYSSLASLPQNTLCQKAYDFAAARLPLSIFNHSIRVYLHAQQLASMSPIKTATDQETLLFIAAVFHDLGTCEEFNGPERFEVCGADAAVAFLREHAPEMPHCDVHDVWIGIACHTSPEIAERISLFSRTVRLAVLIDFDRPGLREEHGLGGIASQIEQRLPRLDIERVLGDAVVWQIMRRHDPAARLRKAPNNSWPGSLLRGELEKEAGFEGINKYF